MKIFVLISTVVQLFMLVLFATGVITSLYVALLPVFVICTISALVLIGLLVLNCFLDFNDDDFLNFKEKELNDED